ncbi:MAG: glycosyltransferase [Nitrospirales bacterium]|nr:glycosyltransferase [Nitrospirales bacterium]
MIWVIIPTYNEAKALPTTLQSLGQQAGQYHVIIVDGGSTDQTPTIVKANPQLTLLTAPKGRASQMNRGASYVRNHHPSIHDWLLFLHADTTLPHGALTRLNQLEEDSSIQAGGFYHQFSGHDWRLRFISWLDNIRCRQSKIIYGDQAMFVRPRLFEQINGFPDQSILEDVAFCQTLIRHTTPTLLAPPVITDSRKFIQMGI